VLPVSAQRQGLQMESKARVSHLQGAGAQFTDQTAQALGARKARGLDRTTRHQPSVVDGLHERPVG